MLSTIISAELAFASWSLVSEQAFRRRAMIFLSSAGNGWLGFFKLNYLIVHLSKAMSRSWPPSWESPLMALTVTFFLNISKTVTSWVPPPKSKITHLFICLESLALSTPNAKAAATGSVINFLQSSPAMVQAFMVAIFCKSLKYAGTVTTQLTTGTPRWCSALFFICYRTYA